jgi:3-phenylpropionate/trans-cinnamate dioxygenase ferredoxin reductase component
MKHYRYLLIGGGIASDAAARAIRGIDASGSIGLIGEEPEPPYDRPPLSKQLWSGSAEELVFRGTGELGVELHLGRRAESLDVTSRTVVDDRGGEYAYDRLLLATGGSPRRLAGEASGEVVYFRTLADFRRLRALTNAGVDAVVLGGGWIGPEIAAALRGRGSEVVLAFPESGIGERLFPDSLRERVGAMFRDQGVDLRTGVAAAAVRCDADGLIVETDTDPIRAGAVVAGLGIRPNTALAVGAGIAVDDGILVDETLATSATGVFAAGDVASILDVASGRHLRVEHEDAANASGWHAGTCMAGPPTPYRRTPYFYSDLFDLSVEVVGHFDPVADTVLEDWVEQGWRGACFSVRDGVVRGVLICNLPGKRRRAIRMVERREAGDSSVLLGSLTT